jgi:general secretion pathway protein D
MLRPSRPYRSLPLALALGLAATTATRLPAQEASPAPEVETPETPAPEVTASLAASPQPEMVGPLLLRDTALDGVLELVERYTGRILLRPSSLPQTNYNLTLDKPLPKEDALRALETLLNMNGIALSPLGDRFLKVSPLNLVRTETPEFIEGSTLGLAPSGRVASKLFTLQYLRVGEFVPLIAQLLNAALNSSPIPFEKNNSALITDSIANLQRIETLVATLDRPASAGFTVKSYQIANAKASELVNQIRTLVSGPLAAQIGTATTFQPDDRTNQILLIGDPREHPFFDQLIATLDAEASPNTRSEVIFLKHATATDVATLLGQLVTGQNTASSRESGSSRGGGRRLSSSTPTPPAEGGGEGANPVAAVNAAAAAVSNAAASEEFSSFLTIVADERSNAIVIAGTPTDIKLVASLVDRIDVLLAQVRIEVVITEVTLSNESSSGISALGLRVEDNKLTGFNAAGPGASIGAITGDGFATSTGYGQNLSAAISLSTTPRKNNATILQTPSVTTTHNKEAEIFVGETRPVISGTTTSSVNADTTSSTVTQQEIGVRLRILPLIGSSGNVQLEIETEVEDILGNIQIDGNDQPIIGRRTSTSYISARNGDIIVLGGLQRASQSRSTSRLGPIPILGDLFGARSREKARTELVFFLRPTILTNSPLDNVEAMQRVDSTAQSKEVRKILETRPAAAPVGQPLTPPPAAEPAPEPEDTRPAGPASRR